MLKLERATEDVGVIATGVDVARLSAADWQTLYQAWLDHGVLVIRGQSLGIEQFLDHGRRFGRLKPHRVQRTRHPEHPELTVMGTETRKADGSVDQSIYNRGVSWHTDGPWDDEICKATQLLGLEIPSFGGDTLFASMVASLEALPPTLRARLAGMQADYAYGGRERRGVDLLEPADRERPAVRHDLIRIHPETGRASLYFNPFHIVRIAGLSERDSDDLIAELSERMVRPDGEYRHRWQAGDLVTWDNRCTLHSATGGYPVAERRVHWRCTIME